MSENEEIVVNIDEWIDKAKADPAAYMERQATEVFLTALGTTEPWCKKFFLKGGLLMGILYKSPRQTADIDYSTTLAPDPKIADQLTESLNKAFPSISANLGYPDIACRIQTIKLLPRTEGFSEKQFPGFKVTVAYAQKGTPQEEKLMLGKGIHVLHADISFKEPVGGFQIVRLGKNGGTISAYSLKDIITEKYRAFLQQEKRNRRRRQDIYDLSVLLNQFDFDDDEKADILDLLIKKCVARDITPDKTSIDNQENINRAKSEWPSLELEIGEVPDFDECFEIAKIFYKSLPWK